jgi:electron transfer flavoprotein beta subunit
VQILVCVKRVPAPGARINVTEDGQGVDAAHLGFTTSPHEECAVEEAVRITEARGGDWDPQRTSAALTEAIDGLEAADGAFDLILFGNESADAGGFQVGVRVAHALDRPIVNGIKSIEVGENTLSARREIDGGFEVYELPMPAALGVKEGINLPRYPTMKGRLASKKAAVGEVAVDTPDGGQTRLRLYRPEEQVSETVILGTGPDAAGAVVDLFEELGVLP